MTASEKFCEIMKKYHSGEFGTEHLSMEEILQRAGESNLFEEMTIEEIQDLVEKSSGLQKRILLLLKQRKEQE